MAPTPEERIAAVAAGQHGALTLAQAVEAGLTRHQVQAAVSSGRWRRAARGVVVVAGAPATWEQGVMVALLARSDAHLSELAAGHVHRLLDAPVEQPVLIVPRGTSSRAPRGRVRRLDLPVDQRTVVRGLRTTSVARTIVDLSATVPSATVRRIVDDAISGRAVSPADLRTVCDTVTHVPLAARRTVLEASSIWEGIAPGSPAEARLLRSIAEWGLPEPERQVPVIGELGQVIARLDLGWPAVHVGLEYDGVAWHGPARWLADEARHALVARAGWTVHHLGARDLLPSSDLRRRLERALAGLACGPMAR